jgi:hypothetical protein
MAAPRAVLDFAGSTPFRLAPAANTKSNTACIACFYFTASECSAVKSSLVLAWNRQFRPVANLCSKPPILNLFQLRKNNGALMGTKS